MEDRIAWIRAEARRLQSQSGGAAAVLHPQLEAQVRMGKRTQQRVRRSIFTKPGHTLKNVSDTCLTLFSLKLCSCRQR